MADLKTNPPPPPKTDTQKQQEEKARQERERQQREQSSSSGSKPQTGGAGAVGVGFAKAIGGVINQPVGYGDSMPSFPSEPLTRDDIKSLAGDLILGAVGYVELDEEGKPTGPAKTDIPEPGKPVARVVGFGPRHYDEVVTPAGAPVTRHMNPATDLWDEGMRLRNPPPIEESRKAEERLEKIIEANRNAMKENSTIK